MRLLLIAAHPAFRRALEQALQDEGHTVESAHGPEAGEARLRASRYDLVIMDLMRPGEHALAVLRRWRQGGHGTPVLGLIAPPHELAGLGRPDLGADEYLAVPFGVEELYRCVRGATCLPDPAPRVRLPGPRSMPGKARVPVAS